MCAARAPQTLVRADHGDVAQRAAADAAAQALEPLGPRDRARVRRALDALEAVERAHDRREDLEHGRAQLRGDARKLGRVGRLERQRERRRERRRASPDSYSAKKSSSIEMDSHTTRRGREPMSTAAALKYVASCSPRPARLPAGAPFPPPPPPCEWPCSIP